MKNNCVQMIDTKLSMWMTSDRIRNAETLLRFPFRYRYANLTRLRIMGYFVIMPFRYMCYSSNGEIDNSFNG